MAMTEQDTELEALFAAARCTRDDLPGGLAARMLDDAARVQAGRSAPAASKPRIWTQLQVALGGWPGLSGLVAASAAGLWIGFAPPTFLPDPVALIYPVEQDVELYQTIAYSDDIAEEG